MQESKRPRSVSSPEAGSGWEPAARVPALAATSMDTERALAAMDASSLVEVIGAAAAQLAQRSLAGTALPEDKLAAVRASLLL